MPHYDSDCISPLAWAVQATMQHGEVPTISSLLKNAKYQWQEWDKMRRPGYDARLSVCRIFANAFGVNVANFILLVHCFEDWKNKRWSNLKRREQAIRLASTVLFQRIKGVSRESY